MYKGSNEKLNFYQRIYSSKEIFQEALHAKELQGSIPEAMGGEEPNNSKEHFCGVK